MEEKGWLDLKRLLVMIISAMLLLAACGGKKVDDETARTYIDQAEQVVSLLNEGDTESVRGMLDDNMKAALTDAQLQEVVGIIEDSGAFEKVDKSSVEEQDSLYVTVLGVKYSKSTRIFTISFDSQQKVAGLFIK